MSIKSLKESLEGTRLPYSDISQYFSSSALEIITLLEKEGFEAWLVGGCVRDALLQRSINDIDIATNALPLETMKVFSKQGLTALPTGITHGTVTVLFCEESYEITTYRIDGSYSDRRHPDDVCFCRSITEDLARRDFTINSLAYHPDRGLLDPFNGIRDLTRKLICATGNANSRFSEDALRILRALRFASELGFSLEENTLYAINDNAEKLKSISSSRITAEFNRLLRGPFAHDALLQGVHVMEILIPELRVCRGFDQKTPYHCYDVWQHCVQTLNISPPRLRLRWAALLHDIGKPDCFTIDENNVGHAYGHEKISAQLADTILKRFEYSNSFIREVTTLIAFHSYPLSAEKKLIKRLIHKLNDDVSLLKDLLALKKADSLSYAPSCHYRALEIDTVNRQLDEIISEQETFSIKELAINGNDLIKEGFESGPLFGIILEEVLQKVMEDKLPNVKQDILAYIRKVYRIN